MTVQSGQDPWQSPRVGNMPLMGLQKQERRALIGASWITEWCTKNSKERMHRGFKGMWESTRGAAKGWISPTFLECNFSVLQSSHLGKNNVNNEGRKFLGLTVKEPVLITLILWTHPLPYTHKPNSGRLCHLPGENLSAAASLPRDTHTATSRSHHSATMISDSDLARLLAIR